MIGRLAVAGAVIGLATGFGWFRSTHDIVEEGNDHFRLGAFAEAAARYEEAAEALPDSPQLHLNRGNVAFRTYQFALAIEHFQLARDTDDVALRALASYQLGNVKYQQAIDAMQSFQDAKTPLAEAMIYYRDCLTLDEGAEDARYNLELALLLYAEIEQQEVQAQRNAELRDQQTSPNAGQAFEGDSPEQRDSDEDAPPRPGVGGRGHRGAPGAGGRIAAGGEHREDAELPGAQRGAHRGGCRADGAGDQRACPPRRAGAPGSAPRTAARCTGRQDLVGGQRPCMAQRGRYASMLSPAVQPLYSIRVNSRWRYRPPTRR